MIIPVAENPRKKLPKWAIRKAGGINKKAWALARQGQKKRTRKSNPRKRHSHRQSYTGKTVRPKLVRAGRGLYRRTASSRQRYPSVRLMNPFALPLLSNPRRRRKRHNPPVLSFDVVKERLVDGAKTTAGVLVVNGITNYLFNNLLPVSSVSSNPTVQKAVKGISKIVIAQLASRYGNRFIGTKAAQDMITVVTVLVILDFVMELLRSNDSTKEWANYLGLLTPSYDVPVSGRLRHIAGNRPVSMLYPDTSVGSVQNMVPSTQLDVGQGG